MAEIGNEKTVYHAKCCIQGEVNNSAEIYLNVETPLRWSNTDDFGWLPSQPEYLQY